MIKFDTIVGRPPEVLSSLRRSLGALARHGDFHQKVGITNNPHVRWAQAYRDWGWRRMTVLYESDRRSDVQDVERELIDWLSRSRTNGYYHNDAPGGEGRPPFNGPHYVYIVGAQKYCRFAYSWA